MFCDQLIHAFIRLFRDRPRQSEVADLDKAALVYEDVGGFDISMHNFCGVQKVHATKYIVYYEFDMIFVKADAILTRVLHKLLEVRVDVLHDNKEVR